MLDNLIVSTAMPRIVGDLHGLSHLPWVITAYVLGTTVSTPLWGKIGDLYGRKGVFLASIVIFLIGSALSGASTTMAQLIGFRALQGLGAGGLLVVGITALVLITTWGGHDYPWLSWQVLGLAGLALVTLAAFLAVERRAAEPVLSLGLFRNRNFTLSVSIGFLLGFAMFGAISYLPLYQQVVQGASATNSGLLLLPMMAGLLVTSLLAGQLITRTGRYKIFPIVGGVIMVVGMLLLSTMTVTTSKTQTALFMAVLGLGMGFLMQTTMLISQNSVGTKDLGVASSAATFFRSIGGSVGVPLAGAVFNPGL